ncbi:hypothetical protein [Kordia sp.]|uniref:hypothetical protein n=1 Tax=Kordia sp. TaxID=1965332 RepID=UPI003B592EFD
MSETHTKGIYYFQSYTDYFWQWEVDYMFTRSMNEGVQNYSGFNCICIPEGMTIAYKEQVEEVLQTIAPFGFPPFGALILTFLATNSGEVSFAVDEIFRKIQENHTNFPSVDHIDFLAAESFLKSLIALPIHYKKGTNRLDLFTFLFQTANHSLHAKYKDDILTCIKNQDFQLNECSRKVEITVSALSKDINALALLHKRYPSVNDLLKAWLNIDEIPVEPEETEYVSEDPDLIQQLIEEPKTFFMGSLIKRIWSGIQLPMHYAHPGEMPLGGISDITNKGKFDNILISEFANDDLIFLHRIANKEALFIRRETTPEEDLRTRIFLIDTTIKSWGTPKTLLYATAFSLIHHPKNEMNFQPYALGVNYKSLDFETKESIIDGLQLTSPLLDAAEAMQKFIDECEEENIEITLFTSPKSLEHANIRKIFNRHHDKFGGVITADIEGNIDVYRMKSGSKRLVKHIQLPLKELWRNPPTRKRTHKKLNTQSDNGNVVNYPILYGFPARNVINFADENYRYIVQKNGDVFRTHSRSKGFEMFKKDIKFTTGIKQHKLAVIYGGEILVLFWTVKNHMMFKTATSTFTFSEDLSHYSKVSFKHLIVYEDRLYLATRKYYSEDPVFTEFDIFEKTYEKVEMPSTGLKMQLKSYLSSHGFYFEGSIFTKINSLTITKDLKLIFNFKHQLELYGESIYLEMTTRDRDQLEEEFTVYFHRRNLRAEFMNGSSITIDKNGVIIFESLNHSIPKFYLSSYIGIDLALATENEFAGEDYFYPDDSEAKKISVLSFEEQYLKPFMQKILNV